MLKLRVLGSLAASIDGEALEGLQSKSLITLLWAKGPEGLLREEAANLLWTNESYAQSSGRLRVALTRLRRQLPSSSLQESQSRLSFNFQEITTDWDEATAELQTFLDEISDSLQVAQASRILELLSLELLPEFQGDWLTHERLRWSELRAEAAKALVSASASQGRSDIAFCAAKAGLSLDPTNEEFLERVLLSAVESDQITEARRIYLESEVKLKEINPLGSFSKKLADLAFGRSETVGQGLDKDQRESIIRFFEKLSDQTPELALEVMALPAFREEILRQPKPTLKLLESCLHRSALESEASHRCLARASLAAGLVHDSQKSIEYAEKALSLAAPLRLKKAVRISCSFTYFWMGLPEKAHSTIDQAIKDCEELGDEVDGLLAKSQKASFWWHEGRLDEAEAAYDHVLEKLAKIGTGSVVDIVTVSMNRTSLAVHKKDWSAAKHLLEQTLSFYRNQRPVHLLPQLKPLQGTILARTGDLARGAELLARGIGLAYRSNQNRGLAVALVYAAELFADNEIQLDSLLPSIKDLLLETGEMQSKAMLARIQELERVAGRPQGPENSETICRKVIQALRALAKGRS